MWIVKNLLTDPQMLNVTLPCKAPQANSAAAIRGTLKPPRLLEKGSRPAAQKMRTNRGICICLCRRIKA
jgi:hypothetical protein